MKDFNLIFLSRFMQIANLYIYIFSKYLSRSARQGYLVKTATNYSNQLLLEISHSLGGKYCIFVLYKVFLD